MFQISVLGQFLYSYQFLTHTKMPANLQSYPISSLFYSEFSETIGLELWLDFLTGGKKEAAKKAIFCPSLLEVLSESGSGSGSGSPGLVPQFLYIPLYIMLFTAPLLNENCIFPCQEQAKYSGKTQGNMRLTYASVQCCTTTMHHLALPASFMFELHPYRLAVLQRISILNLWMMLQKLK